MQEIMYLRPALQSQMIKGQISVKRRRKRENNRQRKYVVDI
jgi:hypothetical protein